MKIIKFSQPSCLPCAAYQKIIDEWTKEGAPGENVDIEYVDCTKEPTLAGKHRIMTVPVTIALDDNGEEIVGKRRVGIVPYDKMSMYLDK